MKRSGSGEGVCWTDASVGRLTGNMRQHHRFMSGGGVLHRKAPRGDRFFPLQLASAAKRKSQRWAAVSIQKCHMSKWMWLSVCIKCIKKKKRCEMPDWLPRGEALKKHNIRVVQQCIMIRCHLRASLWLFLVWQSRARTMWFPWRPSITLEKEFLCMRVLSLALWQVGHFQSFFLWRMIGKIFAG